MTIQLTPKAVALACLKVWVLSLLMVVLASCSWIHSMLHPIEPPQGVSLYDDVTSTSHDQSAIWGIPQRGLLIETALGPVPAQFTARTVVNNPSRCAALNNYWCVKTPTDGKRWEGQVGEDRSGHAYFSDPVYSARAFARIIRSYHVRRNIRSISGIINRYAPSSDCIGSLSYCPINGTDIQQHSAIQTTGRLGDQYVFYTSQRPNSSQFSRGTNCQQILMYCPRGRNQSEEYAADIARSLNVPATSDLGLFDQLGRVHYDQMMTLMKAMAKWELGRQYSVDESLIREGMILEVNDFRQTDPSKWPGIEPRAFSM